MGDATLFRLTRALPVSRTAASSDYDLNAGTQPPPATALTPASVLVPLIRERDRWRVVLTRRTTSLKHHPGQVAFPGGKADPGDTDAVDTALREAEEEIGLPRDRVSVLGTAGRHATVTGFEVTPVVGVVAGAFEPRPEKGEVERIFAVPLDFLFDPANTRIEARIWRGRERRYYALPWGPYYIWGATARMIVALRDAYDRCP